jgi:hypothetical protein
VIADRVGASENTVRAVAKRFADTEGDVLATIGRKPALPDSECERSAVQ